MRKLVPILFLLAACSHRPRTLGDEERLRLGLTGIAYDLPLCPTSYDPATKESKVTGACELVTCEPEDGKLRCTARPQRK